MAFGTQSEADEAREEPIVGSEAWFVEVVGLPNSGLDPRKDVNHIFNKDLLVVFVDKVSYKEYSWKQNKLAVVKKRMEEFYTTMNWASMAKEKGVARLRMGRWFITKNQEKATYIRLSSWRS